MLSAGSFAKGKTKAEAQEIFSQFREAFGELYGWMPLADMGFTSNGDGAWALECKVEAMYKTYNEQTKKLSKAKKEAITDALIDELLYEAGVYKGLSVFNAMGEIYEEIMMHVQYDWFLKNHTAFQGLTCGSAVCDGYSEIFLLACKKCGINVKTIIGKYNGEGHAWNCVTFSDGTLRFMNCTNSNLFMTAEEMENSPYQS